MVRSNRPLFDQLVSSGAIAVRRGEIFNGEPPTFTLKWSRVEGMMLGLAVGDALGNTTEAQLPADRRGRHGVVRDYLPNRFVEGQRKGTPGSPWHAPGTASAGNGSLMRIAPVVVPHLRRPTPDLWVDAALLAMTTHNDAAAISSCVAFTSLLWKLLGMEGAPHPDWWRLEFLGVLGDLDTGQTYTARGGWYSGTGGRFSDLVATRLDHAVDRGWSVADACDAFYSGAYLLETVPCALYILMTCGHDPEEAMIRAVNDTYDNDTIGAIVGAAVGALYGADALPLRWRKDLTGRTGSSDDDRMVEILDAARQKFFAFEPDALPTGI